MGASLVGLKEGYPGVEFGPSRVGLPVTGAAEGAPGITVGTAEVGAAVKGLFVFCDTVVGLAEGVPGVTVGPAALEVSTVGLTVVGKSVVGATDGLPGITVGPAVVGASVVGATVGGAAEGLIGVEVGSLMLGEKSRGSGALGLSAVDGLAGPAKLTVGPDVAIPSVAGPPLLGDIEGLPGFTVGPCVNVGESGYVVAVAGPVDGFPAVPLEPVLAANQLPAESSVDGTPGFASLGIP